jgi:dTDP-4-amino-4,6-dideoxygalactose transaminase
LVDLPRIPENCKHNAHIFHIRTAQPEDRDKLISFLKEKGITASFHYTPLHLSEFGKQYEFRGNDFNTVHESRRLARLPMYFSLTDDEINYVVKAVFEFFGKKV